MKKDWEIKRLGDYCKIRTGKLDANAACENGRYPFFTCSVTPLKINSYSFDCECVLVAGNGDLNVKYYEGKFDAYQRTYIIESVDKTILDAHYLYSFLSSYIDELRKQSIGAIIKYIKLGNLTEAPIPVPPLEEQKRIVKILDEKFAQLESLKANAQTNLQNAKDLFQSQLTKAFSNTTWEKKRLGDVCEIITGPFGSSIHKTDYVPNGIPMINPQNIVDGYIIPLEKCLVSENTAKNLERFKFIENDIVIARRGEMGRCAVIRKENENWLCGTGSFIIRSNSRKVNSDFLQTILCSKESKEKLEKESIGATMSNLNQGILGNFEVPLPTLPEQKRIVKELDALSEKVRQLQEIYTKQIANCDELKQSLLQKAFEGEL